MATIELRVPDIGDDKDVPVIEILVAVGDTVKKDQGLVTLESDKATMDVPAPFAGKVQDIRVKVGDKVSEGTVIMMLASDAPAVSSVFEWRADALAPVLLPTRPALRPDAPPPDPRWFACSR